MSSKSFVADYGDHMADELAGATIGAELGRGTFRTVHEWLSDPSLVLKIEHRRDDPAFSNAIEWTVWETANMATGHPAKDWLAPCVSISNSGNFLFQRRTQPVDPARLPKRVPAWLSDLHVGNWGMLGGRVVCHDYASSLVLAYGLTKRMKVAKWHGLP